MAQDKRLQAIKVFRWPNPFHASFIKFLLVSASVVGLLGCGKTAPQTIAKPAERSVAPRATADVKVSIDNFSFSPPEVSVPPGATIVWVNHDDVPHTVTATAKAFASKALDTDDTFTHRFDQPGTYEY